MYSGSPEAATTFVDSTLTTTVTYHLNTDTATAHIFVFAVDHQNANFALCPVTVESLNHDCASLATLSFESIGN
jgi:hypothetical protein